MFQNFREEVRPINFEIQSAADFVIGELHVLEHVVDQTLRYPVLHKPSAGGIVLHCKAKGRSFELADNHFDPGVIFHVFQAVERFSEPKVTDNVKGCKIVPRRSVENRAFARLDLFSKLNYE